MVSQLPGCLPSSKRQAATNGCAYSLRENVLFLGWVEFIEKDGVYCKKTHRNEPSCQNADSLRISTSVVFAVKEELTSDSWTAATSEGMALDELHMERNST